MLQFLIESFRFSNLYQEVKQLEHNRYLYCLNRTRGGKIPNGVDFFVTIYLRTLRQLRMLFCVEMHKDLHEW